MKKPSKEVMWWYYTLGENIGKKKDRVRKRKPFNKAMRHGSGIATGGVVTNLDVKKGK